VTAAGTREAEVDAFLRAGALLPAGPSAAGGQAISARRYENVALGARPVIKLVPDAIGQAEDLALETLGFAQVGVDGPVAIGRPRGLGFPASAILADPPNAGYALSVVKEMQRFARMAKSKPGNAKDGFDAIGVRLARTVPHFLPSFHEQAGRAFLEAGAQAQAATQFGKAREAERTYALPIDETQRRQAFLEFALAGALSGKSVAEYGQDLSQSSKPAEAHAALKELCIQRTLGGLPPFAGMAAELRRTSKAAGLNSGEEDMVFLKELVEAPATKKAAAGFWTTYRSPLIKAAIADPAFRGKILNLHPTPSEGARAFVDNWIAILRESRALDALLRPESGDPAALPSGGPARWLERTIAQSMTGWRWRWEGGDTTGLTALIDEVAPAVRATGLAIDLFPQHWGDVELLDAVLAAGIGVLDPTPSAIGGVHLDLRGYVGRAKRRPLMALGASEQFATLLDQAIGNAIGSTNGRLAELPGLHEPIRRWLRRQAARCTGGSLVTLADALTELEGGAAAPAVRALDPKTCEDIARTDVAGVLARTIAGGVLAELVWPALEAADVNLGAAEVAGDAWPSVVISDSRRAAAVGAAGTVLKHDLRSPANLGNWAKGRLAVANGQFLVAWRGTGREAYWSGRPNDVFEAPETLLTGIGFWAPRFEASIELPDGSRFEGGRPITAGDRSVSAQRRVFSDGDAVWVLTEGGGLREVDPGTGQLGRPSMPRFFEEHPADGWKLDLDASWLMPTPAGAEASVFGSKDGLMGFRVRSRAIDGVTEWEIEGTDGRSFRGRLQEPLHRGPMMGSDAPVALLSFPGDSAPRPLSRTAAGGAMTIWSADGSFPVLRAAPGTTTTVTASLAFRQVQGRGELAEGVPFIPPALYWYALRPRDTAGSAALRQLTSATARRLLEGVAREPDPKDNQPVSRSAAAERAVAEHLPAITDPKLRAGVAGAVALAGRLQRRLSKFGTAPTQAPAPAKVEDRHESVATVIDDRALDKALSGLLETHGYYSWGGGEPGRPLEQLSVVASVFDRPAAAKKGLFGIFGAKQTTEQITLPASSAPWYQVLGRLGAVALRVALPTTSQEDRDVLAALLRELIESGYPQRSDRIRIITVARSNQGAGQSSGGRMWWNGDRTIFTTAPRYWSFQGQQHVTGFEYAASGSFGLEPGTNLVDEERPGRGWGEASRVTQLLATVAADGPVSWSPAAVDLLQSRTGLSRAAAALLLAGLPGIDSDEHNFLAPAVRELLDLKATEARAARDLLKTLTRAQRLALLDGAMPSDPKALWSDGLMGVAQRLAEGWVQLKGRRIVIEDEVLARAARELKFYGSPPDPLRLLADANDPKLAKEPPIDVAATWGGNTEPGDAFTSRVLRSLAISIPWAHATLPAGHVVLQNLPEVVGRIHDRLRSDSLVLPLGTVVWPKHQDAWRALGARAWTAPRGAKVLGAAVEWGPIVATDLGNDYVRLWLRPAVMGREGLAEVLSALQPDGRAVIEGSRFLLGRAALEIAERSASSPLAAGSFEADPRQSSPDILGRAQAALGVSEDAATLFLQVLALPSPTKAALQAWNGWTSAAIAKAAKPLLDAGVVVEGKRARSGRDIFLAGAWSELPAPDLPVEAWKLPMYGAAVASDGTVTKPLDRLVVMLPLHALFAEAWNRWEAGDRPGFEAIAGRRGR
jgi:hypothetical protein